MTSAQVADGNAAKEATGASIPTRNAMQHVNSNITSTYLKYIKTTIPTIPDLLSVLVSLLVIENYLRCMETILGLFGGGVNFDPKRDVPSLEGKVVMVTGGNSGLGAETILKLAAHKPKEIFLAARNSQSSREAIARIQDAVADCPKITFLELDLTSLESVKKAGAAFGKQSQRLDLLILNAGVMATAPCLTKDGYELQFGTNHVGHAALTKVLMPVLLHTAAEPDSDVRIVVLTSLGHKGCPSGGVVFEEVKTEMEGYSTWIRYGQSKLANILFAKELDRRFGRGSLGDKGIKAVAVHPGLVATGLTRGLREGWPLFDAPIRLGTWLVGGSVAQGARNQLWAATAKDVKGGGYYEPVGRPAEGSELTRDEALAARLWEWTEGELKKHAFSDGEAS